MYNSVEQMHLHIIVANKSHISLYEGNYKVMGKEWGKAKSNLMVLD